jgi:hypothetical protein
MYPPAPSSADPAQILKTAYKNVKTTNAWIVAERAPKGQLDAAEPILERCVNP